MWVLLILIVLYFVYLYFSVKIKSPQEIGKEGELIVANLLGETVEGEKYVINDLIIVDKEGESSQIDHIFINKFGIWVVETKHFSGYIYGYEDEKMWTQSLAYGNEKHEFYNPVKQNFRHIYRLKEVLEDDSVPMHNIVVFTNTEDINTDADQVCTARELLQILWKERKYILTKSKMEFYYNKLKLIKDNGKMSIDEHVHHINEKKKDIQNNICPRCGSDLVLRNGKNGDFFGCSSYPKCKFTKNKEWHNFEGF